MSTKQHCERHLRAELIQVAAVAVAAIHDLDHGGTGNTVPWCSATNIDDGVAAEVLLERERQEKKWGNQHHSPELWLSILMEEVGEAAQEVLRMLLEPVRETDARKGSDDFDVDDLIADGKPKL